MVLWSTAPDIWTMSQLISPNIRLVGLLVPQRSSTPGGVIQVHCIPSASASAVNGVFTSPFLFVSWFLFATIHFNHLRTPRRTAASLALRGNGGSGALSGVSRHCYSLPPFDIKFLHNLSRSAGSFH